MYKRFEIGDKVMVLNVPNAFNRETVESHFGTVATIIKVDDSHIPYKIKLQNGRETWVKAHQIGPVAASKPSFKVGDLVKVTGRSIFGKQLDETIPWRITMDIDSDGDYTIRDTTGADSCGRCVKPHQLQPWTQSSTIEQLTQRVAVLEGRVAALDTPVKTGAIESPTVDRTSLPVGTRVKIVSQPRSIAPRVVGKLGTIKLVDSSTLPYLINVDGVRDYWFHAHDVEKYDEPASPKFKAGDRVTLSKPNSMGSLREFEGTSGTVVGLYSVHKDGTVAYKVKFDKFTNDWFIAQERDLRICDSKITVGAIVTVNNTCGFNYYGHAGERAVVMEEMNGSTKFRVRFADGTQSWTWNDDVALVYDASHPVAKSFAERKCGQFYGGDKILIGGSHMYFGKTATVESVEFTPNCSYNGGGGVETDKNTHVYFSNIEKVVTPFQLRSDIDPVQYL